MDRFLTLPAVERGDIIRETATQMQLHPTPVEKDFWVCWVLKELFALSSVKEHLIFKGGTSLSKAYGVIDRFSEDIDLSVDTNAFGVTIESDFYELSPNQRNKYLGNVSKAARDFINDIFLPELTLTLDNKLDTLTWSLKTEEVNRGLYTLSFRYPSTLSSTSVLSYARPFLQIDISVRAEHEPSELKSITSYVAEQFGEQFDNPDTTIKVLDAKRTFWEKVTLLHAESTRPEEESLPARLARHAYDLHRLMESGIGNNAIAEIDLLERVARHKTAFYFQRRVDYEAAYSGHLQIVPNSRRLEELKSDYTAMRDFFIGEPPGFDDILASLGQIQTRVNSQCGGPSTASQASVSG